jgi:glycosyltransferase involved in cell wall biosynthesis
MKTVSRICVVTPYLPSPSETFIRGHVTDLPASALLVHGWRPTVGERRVLSLPSRLLHKAGRMLFRTGIEREVTAAYMKVFRDHRADAVLAEYGATGVVVGAACRRLGIPLVVHFHGFDASVRSLLEEHVETYPAMFRSAAAIVAVSQAMRTKLISLGAPDAKVHYNPCGVDCGAFAGGSPADAPPVLLAVGRLVEKKAPQLTLTAFAEVFRAEPAARLRMIGDGPLLEACRELATALAIDQAVTFLGIQPPEVVQREMRGARAFVQHSVEGANGDCEGTPVGILEAGASGLPVVATRHGGIPDVVIEGETGFLVAEKDVSGMATHMLTLVRSPELAGRMGQQARARIEGHFSNARSLARLWSIIEAAGQEDAGSRG